MQSASCASTSVTTMAAPIAGCTHKRRSGHAGCRRCGRRQRAPCAACRSSADYTTNTPSLSERHTTLSPRSPGHSVGAFTPHGHEHGRACVAPATLHAGCADFRWGAVDHANPCQLPLQRALTESQALHTPHGIIAAYTRASAALRFGMLRFPCPCRPPCPGRSHNSLSTSGRGRA